MRNTYRNTDLTSAAARNHFGLLACEWCGQEADPDLDGPYLTCHDCHGRRE